MSNKMALDALTPLTRDETEHGREYFDAAQVRAALQAEPQPEQEEEFTQGVNAAVAMLEKIAADHCEKHAWTDPDTGVRELKPGPIEDYYNTVMELAGNVRSIVHAPGSKDLKKGGV